MGVNTGGVAWGAPAHNGCGSNMYARETRSTRVPAISPLWWILFFSFLNCEPRKKVQDSKYFFRHTAMWISGSCRRDSENAAEMISPIFYALDDNLKEFNNIVIATRFGWHHLQFSRIATSMVQPFRWQLPLAMIVDSPRGLFSPQIISVLKAFLYGLHGHLMTHLLWLVLWNLLRTWGICLNWSRYIKFCNRALAESGIEFPDGRSEYRQDEWDSVRPSEAEYPFRMNRTKNPTTLWLCLVTWTQRIGSPATK
jgi:hypothetical protein